MCQMLFYVEEFSNNNNNNKTIMRPIKGVADLIKVNYTTVLQKLPRRVSGVAGHLK